MGLHASKEGRLETKREHDGAKVQHRVGPADCAEMAVGPAGGKGGSTKSSKAYNLPLGGDFIEKSTEFCMQREASKQHFAERRCRKVSA